MSEGRVRAVELFDSPETYRRMHRKLIERFALEITAQQETPHDRIRPLIEQMLREIARLGRSLKIEGNRGTTQSKDKTLSALWGKDNRLLHLCLE